MASISSMNTIHGAFCFACSNKSRTREAPTPTNISTKSEPEIERNGTFASPATALASSVLPVPGGPTSSAPLGILAPNSRYLSALRRKSTISIISTLASDRPATSLNVTRFEGLSLSNSCARALPTFIMPPPAPPPPRDIERMKKNQMPIRNNHGRKLIRISLQPVVSFRYSSVTGLSSRPESVMACLTSRSRISTEPIVKLSCSPCSGRFLKRLFSSPARYAAIASSVRYTCAVFLLTTFMRSTSPWRIICSTVFQSLVTGTARPSPKNEYMMMAATIPAHTHMKLKRNV